MASGERAAMTGANIIIEERVESSASEMRQQRVRHWKVAWISGAGARRESEQVTTAGPEHIALTALHAFNRGCNSLVGVERDARLERGVSHPGFDPGLF